MRTFENPAHELKYKQNQLENYIAIIGNADNPKYELLKMAVLIAEINFLEYIISMEPTGGES